MARPRQVSDDEIRQAARQVFLEHGPGVSVSVIAEELGISQAALFKRCGTKKALLVTALAPDRSPPFVEWLGREPTDAPLAAQLRELFELMSAFFSEMIPCISALRASGIDPEELMLRKGEPMPLKVRRMLSDWLARAQARGLLRPDVNCEVLATASMGALQVRAFLSHISGTPLSGADPGVYLDELVSILVRGATPSEDHP